MEMECSHPRKSETKNDEMGLKPSVPSVPTLLNRWTEYCDITHTKPIVISLIKT